MEESSKEVESLKTALKEKEDEVIALQEELIKQVRKQYMTAAMHECITYNYQSFITQAVVLPSVVQKHRMRKLNLVCSTTDCYNTVWNGVYRTVYFSALIFQEQEKQEKKKEKKKKGTRTDI